MFMEHPGFRKCCFSCHVLLSFAVTFRKFFAPEDSSNRWHLSCHCVSRLIGIQTKAGMFMVLVFVSMFLSFTSWNHVYELYRWWHCTVVGICDFSVWCNTATTVCIFFCIIDLCEMNLLSLTTKIKKRNEQRLLSFFNNSFTKVNYVGIHPNRYL